RKHRLAGNARFNGGGDRIPSVHGPACGIDMRAAREPGDAIQIYLTGAGKATPDGDPFKPPLATGTIAPVDGSVLYRTLTAPSVTIGAINAPVQFSGIAPGNAGLYQINVAIPTGVPPGDDVE